MSLASASNPALFLDRDGVINIDRHYVHQIAQFTFIDGIFELGRRAQDAGFKLVVVTNQAGIGRGYYTEAQFHTLSDWMCQQFAEEGVVIDRVYYCPYHPEYGIGAYKVDSFDRKPNPGMILRARDELGLSLEESILIGDSGTDIAAARAANIGRTVLKAAPEVQVSPLPDLQLDCLHTIGKLLFP